MSWILTLAHLLSALAPLCSCLPQGTKFGATLADNSAARGGCVPLFTFCCLPVLHHMHIRESIRLTHYCSTWAQQCHEHSHAMHLLGRQTLAQRPEQMLACTMHELAKHC